MNQLGVVVRSNEAQLVEVQRAFRAVRIHRVASAPVAGGGEATDLADTLQSLVGPGGAKGARCAISVPASDVLVRSFTLPWLPKSERPGAVQSESRKHTPFKLEELACDFHITELPKEKRLSVVFVGMKKDVLMKFQEAWRRVGLAPLFVEPEPASLARLSSSASKAAKGRYVGIVDVGPSTAQLVIAKDELPFFSQEIRLLLTSGTANGPAALEPPQVAETPGQMLGTLGESERAPSPEAEALLGELRLSLDYFVREHPGSSVDRLVLFGTDQDLIAWRAWLARQLGCHVEVGALPFKPASGTKLSACAAGLTLRLAGKARTRLNMLGRPKAWSLEESKQRLEAAMRQRQQRIGTLPQGWATPVLVEVVVAALLLAGLKMVHLQQITKVQQEHAQIIASFPDVGWGLKQKARPDLETLQTQTGRQLAFLQNVLTAPIFATQKLDALARELPRGIWLQNLQYTNALQPSGAGQAKLNLSGACYLPEQAGQELGAINAFVSQMQRHPAFQRGLGESQLAEIKMVESDREAVSYRTFRLAYTSRQTGGNP